jgi:hypothetical protein
MNRVTSASKNSIKIESGGATHQVGGQRFSYFFFTEKGMGDLVGSKNRSFQGHFDNGRFKLHGGLEVETIAADYDPSHAGVTTHPKSLNSQRERAVTKMERFRILALKKQSELRAAFDAMEKKLVEEKSAYIIRLREDRIILRAWSAGDKIYIEEFQYDKVWLSPYEHDEPYEDALRSVREHVANYESSRID